MFLAQRISAQLQLQLQFEANTKFDPLTGLSRSSCASCSLSPSSCTSGPASTCCCCCCWRREDGDAAVLLLPPLPVPLTGPAATKALGDAPPVADVATGLALRGESPVGLLVLVLAVVVAVVLLLLLLVLPVLAAAARCDCTAALRGDSVTAKLFSSC
jgi:hypothetical protein